MLGRIAAGVLVALAVVPSVSAARLEHWVYVQLAPGEHVTVLSQSFAPVATARDGDTVKWTGPPGRYAVLVSRDGALETLIAEIGGVPGPAPVPPPPGPSPVPPGPTPAPSDLTGFALEVYQQAYRVGDPAGAKQLSANFAAAAKHRGTRDAVVAELIRLNELTAFPRWVEFGKWAGAEANKRGQTLPEIRAVYTDFARGLEAVAR